MLPDTLTDWTLGNFMALFWGPQMDALHKIPYIASPSERPVPHVFLDAPMARQFTVCIAPFMQDAQARSDGQPPKHREFRLCVYLGRFHDAEIFSCFDPAFSGALVRILPPLNL